MTKQETLSVSIQKYLPDPCILLLECGYHVLMSTKGFCQNPYFSMWQCCGIFVSSEFDLLILQNADQVIGHEACRQNIMQPSCMISYFLMEFQYLQKNHLQHIRFMSHVAYTADNVTDTGVLIIKTNALHMGKTQK